MLRLGTGHDGVQIGHCENTDRLRQSIPIAERHIVIIR